MSNQTQAFLNRVQSTLKSHKIDCWLIYVKKEMRTWLLRELGLENAHISRPVYFLFYAKQKPIVLYSELDSPSFIPLQDSLFEKKTYFTYVEQRSKLKEFLQEIPLLSIDILEEGALPSLSTLDAGIKSWIDSIGCKTISSSTFSDEILATITKEGLASHLFAAKALEEILDEAFAWIEKNMSKKEIYEKEVADLICQAMRDKKLIVSQPIVAFGPNSANPHYETLGQGKKLQKGDVVLIDLWSKQDMPHAIYADFTQVGFALFDGKEVPKEVLEVFACVQNAQSQVIENLTKRLPKEKITGSMADSFARSYIQEKGYGEFFRHRTGHNVGEDCHGLGVNLDSIEFPDKRALLKQAIFTVEPGIYLPGKFGVRLECDLYIDANFHVQVTGGRQNAIAILRSS